MRPRMFSLLFVLITTGTILSASSESYSVSITTEPSQGPFRIGQHVQFSCSVEPTPPDPVIYQWRTVEYWYGGRNHTSQNFSRYYDASYLQYCWYFCEVSANQALVDSANKLIELQGVLYTDEPVVRSFNRGETLHLNVKISNDTQFIASLAWYHNGTRIRSGNKFTITDNDTALSISNMADYDTGIYEVKISSIVYNSTSSPRCDSGVLPLLEHIAAHAPVVFTVQEHSLPDYNPQSVINTLYVTENCNNAYPIMHKVQLSISLLPHQRDIFSIWYSNGSYITNGNMYNSTDEIIGNYVGLLLLDTAKYLSDIQCQDYVGNIGINDLVYFFLLDVSYWSIKLSNQRSFTLWAPVHTIVGNGSSVSSYEADMLVPTDVAIVASKELPLVLGDYVTLTCSPSNHTTNTTYQFTWLHNHSLLLEHTTPTLVLPGVSRRDLGEYQCMATSHNATGSATINITAKATIARGEYGSRVSSSCSSQSTRDAITRETFQLMVEELGARPFGQIRAYPATSCQEIRHAHPGIGAGHYWISQGGGDPIKMYCAL